jgi:hypothetical protein
MTVHFYSTLSADVAYSANPIRRPDDSYEIPKTVVIKGGHGIANSNIITPYGVRTEVSDEAYAAIKDCSVLKLHIENGFIKVESAKDDAEKVAADMTGRDLSAPMTENDYGDNDPEAAQPQVTKRGRK